MSQERPRKIPIKQIGSSILQPTTCTALATPSRYRAGGRARSHVWLTLRVSMYGFARRDVRAVYQGFLGPCMSNTWPQGHFRKRCVGLPGP
jgi:hypothetical protein